MQELQAALPKNHPGVDHTPWAALSAPARWSIPGADKDAACTPAQAAGEQSSPTSTTSGKKDPGPEPPTHKSRACGS